MKLAYAVATPDVKSDVLAVSGDLAESFARLACCGYDGVELMPARPQEVDAAQIESAARAHGLAVPVVCTGELFGQEQLMFTDPEPDRRQSAIDSVKCAIDIAGRLGGNINIGRVRGKLGPDGEHSEALAFEAFRECSEHGATRDVKVLIEPVASSIADFIHTTQDGLNAMSRVDHPNFGLMLDVAHMMAEGENLAQSFAEAADRLDHVHVTDDQRRPPGQGRWDVASMLDSLATSGYDGWVSVESWQVPDPVTAYEGAYKLLRRWQT